MMAGSEERQRELTEAGAGSAVADLKAGFGQEPPVPPVPGWGAEGVAETVLAAQESLREPDEEGDVEYWMRRARRAEGRLRQVSALVAATVKRVGKLDDLMRNWRDADE